MPVSNTPLYVRLSWHQNSMKSLKLGEVMDESVSDDDEAYTDDEEELEEEELGEEEDMGGGSAWDADEERVTEET